MDCEFAYSTSNGEHHVEARHLPTGKRASGSHAHYEVAKQVAMQRLARMMVDTSEGAQPLPIPNDLPSMHDLVAQDMALRKQQGFDKYGTLLQPHNGRDALRDAYEEALDGAAYLRQALYERDGQ
jgi:hypothetical protein